MSLLEDMICLIVFLCNVGVSSTLNVPPPLNYCSVLLQFIFSFISLQTFPTEGLANVVRNVFDFDSYNNEMREILIRTLHKHGIPIGAKPTNIQLAKE